MQNRMCMSVLFLAAQSPRLIRTSFLLPSNFHHSCRLVSVRCPLRPAAFVLLVSLHVDPDSQWCNGTHNPSRTAVIRRPPLCQCPITIFPSSSFSRNPRNGGSTARKFSQAAIGERHCVSVGCALTVPNRSLMA